MVKRVAGAPLTEAEHKQREDAARARWGAAEIGASVAGAAAGVSGAQAVVRHRIAAGAMAHVAASAIAPGAEIKRHTAKDARIQLNGLRATAQVNRKWPVPALRAALFQDKRNAVQRLREGERDLAPILEHERLVRESLAGEPPADEDETRGIRQHIRERNRNAPPESIADLSRPVAEIKAVESKLRELAGARPAGSKPRAGRQYRLTEHTRRVAVGRELRDKYAARLVEAQGAADEAGEQFTPPRHWFRTTYKDVAVKPKAEISRTEAHRVRVEGTPDANGITGIRRQLTARIQSHISAHRAAEEAVHEARMASLRPPIDAVLRWAPSRKFKLASLVAGAFGGAVAGYGAAAGAHQLAKADDAEDAADGEDSLPMVSSKAEPTLAQALARIFGQWKDDATDKLLTPREGTLYSTMLTDLDRATRPLDGILRAGANAPVEAMLPTDDGGARTILVTIGNRDPGMEDWIRNYRQDRIVGLAQTQRDAIRDTLLRAAQNGDSPDEMARQIRQTIGLTANQAQAVLNYRQQLLDLDPAALKRGLRDKRYDRVIDSAVNNAGTLSPAVVDRAVDAYHRKMLASRAMTIARTEGVGAANNSHVESVRRWLNANPDYTVIKGWSAKLDKKTRPDHHAMHGQSVVGIDTPFVCDSGETIRYPHDPNAAAKEVINCRCFPTLRIVSRKLAAQMGMGAVRPFSAELKPTKGIWNAG
jgi:hypothetical protein